MQRGQLNEALYDTKIGFTITNLSLNHSDSYTCLKKIEDKEHVANYVLTVQPAKESLTERKMQIDDSIANSTLYVNCTAEMELSMQYEFDWNTPQNSSKRSFQEFIKYLDRNNILVTSQLIIFNVTDEDSGDYECILRTNYGKKMITKKIPKPYYQWKPIRFKPLMNTTYYEKQSGSNIEWKILVIDTFDNSNLQWYKNEKIVENCVLSKCSTSVKYVLEGAIKVSTLEIKSLDILDSGTYTLHATNEYVTEKLNVTLDVIGEPTSILISNNSYYPPNENIEFHCDVISNPLPNITWSFLKYPNYPSLENSTILNLTNTSAAYTSNYIVKSVATMLIETPGKITCESCNKLGCHSMTEDILVSDGLGAFGIIGPNESVLKGDNVELICAASVYNYTDEFTWTIVVDQTEQPLVETERLKIVRHKTPFTYRSILKFDNVQESDAEDYFCTGKIMNTSNHKALIPFSDREKYKLVIHDPVSPYFAETNMNKIQTRIIDMNERRNETVLKCYADGMPKPTVSWYKDNMLLKENDQYSFEYNHQELHIKYFTQHDSGKYSCRALSRLGTSETYQEITVKDTKWHTLDTVLVTSIPTLGFILLIVAIPFTIRIYRKKKTREELRRANLLHFEKGALESLNPNLTVDDQAELLPYDKKWEFPRERLKLKEQLGSGNFGVVLKAEAIGICKNENVTTVAVKMVHRTSDPIYIRSLTSELKIMVHLGKHLNVVNLLGACTKSISKCELLVIVEYCHFGNLHNYLLRHRNDFINQINPETGKYDFTIDTDILTRNVNVNNDNSFNTYTDIDISTHYRPESNPDASETNFLPDCVLSDTLPQPESRSNYYNDLKDKNTKPITTHDLLSWAFQVARGMEYLSKRKILHGDLAARNILLAEDNVVKICDFGLAKTIYKDSNYKKSSDIPVPIKWMAVESIGQGIFSTQSDVWGFGIVLWEFFTLAKTPYPGMDAEKQYQKLIGDYRLEQPDYAIDEIYNIMLQCWIAKPMLRPSFTDLVESIGNLLEEGVRVYYVTLNNPYMDINMMNLKDEKDDYLMMMSAPDHAILSLPINKCENSLSREASDSSDLHVKSICSPNESKIFSSKPREDHSNIELLPYTSDSKATTDLPPMLKHREDLSEADQRANSEVEAIIYQTME